jgi:hypothetical protein
VSTLDLRSEARAVKVAVPVRADLDHAARATWLGRMVNEHGSARVFEALAVQAGRAGLDEEVRRICLGFAAEERRHGVLCGAVVEALGGDAVAEALADEEVPLHEDAAPLEGLLRNLLSISCLSETVAVSLIGDERLQMPAGELRDLLTGIYADEVGHARFGWRLVRSLAPGLDARTRARLSIYLRVAFGHLEAHELSHLPMRPAPKDGEVLGLCSGCEARELFFETVGSIIVPGLEEIGLAAREAWATRVLPEAA